MVKEALPEDDTERVRICEGLARFDPEDDSDTVDEPADDSEVVEDADFMAVAVVFKTDGETEAVIVSRTGENEGVPERVLLLDRDTPIQDEADTLPDTETVTVDDTESLTDGEKDTVNVGLWLLELESETESVPETETEADAVDDDDGVADIE